MPSAAVLIGTLRVKGQNSMQYQTESDLLKLVASELAKEFHDFEKYMHHYSLAIIQGFPPPK